MTKPCLVTALLLFSCLLIADIKYHIYCRRKSVCLLFAIIQLVLATCAMAGSTGANTGGEFNDLSIPFLSVSSTPKPPTINGRIETDEWNAASSVTGFVTLGRPQASPDKTIVYVTFDESNLYVAYKLFIEGNQPKAIKVKRDDDVSGGDSIELYIQPPHMDPNKYFHFVGNYHGSIYDSLVDFKKNKHDVSWNGHWTFKNYVWENTWSAEISIPLSDLGVQNPLGLWRMNFCRTTGSFSEWSFTGAGYHEPSRFGRILFSDTRIAPKIDLIQGLEQGDLTIRGSAHNFYDSIKNINVQAVLSSAKSFTDTSTSMDAANRITNAMDLDSGKSRNFELTREFNDKHLNLLQINMSAEGKTLYSARIPFQLAEQKYIKIIPVVTEDKFIARIDLRRIKASTAINVRCTPVLVDSNHALPPVTWKNVTVGQVRDITQDINDWPLGQYALDISFCNPADNRTIYSEKVPYLRRPMPEWYKVGITLGRGNKVLAPWSPIKQTKDGLELWGRRYVPGSSMLLEQLYSQGQAILAAPMEITGIVAGKPVSAILANRQMKQAADDQYHWLASGTLGPVPLEADCTLEYDGMLKVELTIFPKDIGKIEELNLAVSMPADQSDYCHYSTCYYDTVYSGYLPQACLDLPFVPYLWMGNMKRGLMWFAEGPINWRTDDTPLHIMRKHETNTLQVCFISKQTALDKPVKFVFGLQATPVKPLPHGWRAFIPAHPDLYNAKSWDEKVGKLTLRMWTPEIGTDAELKWVDEMGKTRQAGSCAPLNVNTKKLRELRDQDAARNIKTVLYHYLDGATSGRVLDFDRYWDTFVNMPTRTLDDGTHGLIVGCSLSGPYQDLLLYAIKNLIDKANIDGMYFDGGSGPSISNNSLHGLGWMDESGKRQGQYPIFAAREFAKRLATMLSEIKGPDKYIIWNHISQNLDLPILSFSTAFLEGEAPFLQVMYEGPKLTDLASLDYLRVMATGEPFGIPPTFLVYRRAGDPNVLQATMAMLLPHGTPIYCLGDVIYSEPDWNLVTHIWKAQTEFGIADANFTGYWDANDLIKVLPNDGKLICSVYSKKNSALLVVSNIGKQPKTAEILLKKPYFADVRDKKARDAISGEPLSISDGKISLPIDKENFRLIRVE